MPNRIAKSSLQHRPHGSVPVPVVSEKYTVEIDVDEDPELTRVVLTERSMFGSTSIGMSPQSARRLAMFLLSAADIADEGGEALPKLAAAL